MLLGIRAQTASRVSGLESELQGTRHKMEHIKSEAQQSKIDSDSKISELQILLAQSINTICNLKHDAVDSAKKSAHQLLEARQEGDDAERKKATAWLDATTSGLEQSDTTTKKTVTRHLIDENRSCWTEDAGNDLAPGTKLAYTIADGPNVLGPLHGRTTDASLSSSSPSSPLLSDADVGSPIRELPADSPTPTISPQPQTAQREVSCLVPVLLNVQFPPMKHFSHLNADDQLRQFPM